MQHLLIGVKSGVGVLRGARIAIDGRLLALEEASSRGIGHYTEPHLKKIFELLPEVNFSIFVDELTDSSLLNSFSRYPNVSIHCYEDSNRPSFDLVHFPDVMSPVLGFDSPFIRAPYKKSTAVFYDLIPLVLQSQSFDLWPQSAQILYRTRLRQMQNSDTRLLCISQNTANDVERIAGIPKERLVYIGAACSLPKPEQSQAGSVLLKHKITKPFILVVGALDAHKNFAATAAAFVHLKQQVDLQLVVVGSFFDPNKQSYRSQLERDGVQDVLFVGFVPPDELALLYSRAQALSFPSYYEGFGFPPLEAMACGCPVVASNRASLPEVLADAGVLIDPDDRLSLVNALRRIITDVGYADELRSRGKAQAEHFTWNLVASRTIDVWRELLESEPVQGGRKGREQGMSFCIITNGKRPQKLRRTLESIGAFESSNVEILVGGETSEDLGVGVDYIDMPDAARNGRLGEMRNRLCERATYSTLVVTDDDMVFDKQFFNAVKQYGSDFDALAVRLLNPDGSRYWDWAAYDHEGHRLLPYDVEHPAVYVTGGLCVLKASVFDAVQWDEARGFYQNEDIDFSARLKAAGFKIKFCKDAIVTHDDNRYTQCGERVDLRGRELQQFAPGIFGAGIARGNDDTLDLGLISTLVVDGAYLSEPAVLKFDLVSVAGADNKLLPADLEVFTGPLSQGKVPVDVAGQSIGIALDLKVSAHPVHIKLVYQSRAGLDAFDVSELDSVGLRIKNLRLEPC